MTLDPVTTANTLRAIVANKNREIEVLMDAAENLKSFEKCIHLPQDNLRTLTVEILNELERARTKFPGDNVTMLALMEEVGELAKATFEESRANVRKEAVQVAVMAIRVILDGDATLNDWRVSKGLDPLTC